MDYNVTLRRVRAAIVKVEKLLVSHSLSIFVALFIKYVMRMRRVIICCLSGYTLIFHIIP
jgi:hypothetical protein